MMKIIIKIKNIVLGVCICVIGVFGMQAYAADKAAGSAKYASVCTSCHGKGGNSQVPTYPKLNGQHAAYLVESLKGYKSGERSSQNAKMMQPFATMLSEDDMRNIAAYLADQ